MSWKKVLIIVVLVFVLVIPVYGKNYNFAKDGPIAKTKLIDESELRDVITLDWNVVPRSPIVKPYKSEGLILKWDKVTEADSYIIYRKIPQKSFKEIDRTEKLVHISKGLKNNTTYYFKVAAVKDNKILGKSYWVSAQTKNKKSKRENAVIDTLLPYGRDGGNTVKTGNPKVFLSLLNIRNKNYDATYWKSVPFDFYIKTKREPVSTTLRLVNRSSNIIKLGMVSKDDYIINKCFRRQFDRLNGLCIKDALSYKKGRHKPGDVVEIDVIAHNGGKVIMRYLLVIHNHDSSLILNPNTYLKNFKKYGNDEYKKSPDIIYIK